MCTRKCAAARALPTAAVPLARVVPAMPVDDSRKFRGVVQKFPTAYSAASEPESEANFKRRTWTRSMGKNCYPSWLSMTIHSSWNRSVPICTGMAALSWLPSPSTGSKACACYGNCVPRSPWSISTCRDWMGWKWYGACVPSSSRRGSWCCRAETPSAMRHWRAGPARAPM